eukprot:3115938-Rhodomonas_salina.1
MNGTDLACVVYGTHLAHVSHVTCGTDLGRVTLQRTGMYTEKVDIYGAGTCLVPRRVPRVAPSAGSKDLIRVWYLEHLPPRIPSSPSANGRVPSMFLGEYLENVRPGYLDLHMPGA